MRIVIVFALLWSISVQTNTCTDYATTLNLIQTGIIAFSSQQSLNPNLAQSYSNRQYCEQVPVLFPVPSTGLSYALALNNYNSYDPVLYGSDFLLSGHLLPSTPNFVATLLIGGQNWTSISVMYLLEARPEIYTGLLLMNTGSTFDCNANGASSSSAWTILAGWNKVPASQIVAQAVYISGIRSGLTSLSIQTSMLIDPSIGNLTVTLTSSTANVSIQFVQITYIIAQSCLYYPTISPLIYLNQASGIVYDYFFTAASSLHSSQPTLATVSMISDVYTCSGRCNSTCISSWGCLNAGGNLVNKNCIVCNLGEVYDSNNNVCRCGLNSITANSICTQCQLNSSPDPTQSVCLCTLGFTMTNGVCVQTCGQSATFSATLQQCVCSNPSMVYSAGSCQCPGGAMLVRGICSCNSTSYLSSNGCIACRGNLIGNGTSCTCPFGYVYDANTQTCLYVPRCGANAVFANKGSQICVCSIANGVMDSNGNCACSALFSFVNGVCLCNTLVAYVNQNGNCALRPVCVTGQVMNPQTNLCECSNPDKTFNGYSCQCPSNKVANFDDTTCICSSGTVWLSSQCAACWPNSHFSNGACLCDTNYYLAGPSLCTYQPICVPGAIFNTTQQICVCSIPSQVITTTGCLCPSPTFLSPLNQCVCSLGTSTSQLCSCLSGATYVTGSGCIKSVSSASVQLLGNVCYPGVLYTAFCVGNPASKLPCNCTWNINVTVIKPNLFNPLISTQGVNGYPSCFVVSFSDPNVASTDFTISIMVLQSNSNVWQQGPLYEIGSNSLNQNNPFPTFGKKQIDDYQQLQKENKKTAGDGLDVLAFKVNPFTL